MKKIHNYFKLLFQTYKIFFQAALLISLIVVALTPLEALTPVLGVQAGQQLVDNLSSGRPYLYFFVLWTIATLLNQALPVVGTNFQGMLTDKLTGFIELSGGQWQKIALARCLHKESRLLFLDEPTSALDARSEQQMYQAFLKENTSQTILFVTHRISAVTLADRVLFLQAGKVAGLASHTELMQANQDYRELYQLQKDAYK